MRRCEVYGAPCQAQRRFGTKARDWISIYIFIELLSTAGSERSLAALGNSPWIIGNSPWIIFEVTMLDRVFVTMQNSTALRESSWIFWCYNPQEVFCFCFLVTTCRTQLHLGTTAVNFLKLQRTRVFLLNCMQNSAALRNSPWLNFFNCSPQLSLFYNWNAFWQHLGTVRKFFWSYKSLFYSCMQVQLH